MPCDGDHARFKRTSLQRFGFTCVDKVYEAAELAVRELAFAKAYKILTSWGKAWNVVCRWIVDRQPAAAKAKVISFALDCK